MMAKQPATVINARISDAALSDLANAVIEYEALSRGLTRGQAVYELVTRAARVDSYPEEIRDKLSDLEQERRDRAIRCTLAPFHCEDVA